MIWHLQNRWRIEGKKLVYYGLRREPGLLKNELRPGRARMRIIASLPRELSGGERLVLGRLLGDVIVPGSALRSTPQSLSEARFCSRCCANDFMIPGLEFDEHGLCPMCATEGKTKNLRSIVPLVREIPRSSSSRFDVGLFYTGGKDSSFLLYYLSKICGLRVLAMTWDIPFMSDSARRSMENAKKHFPHVEFVSKALPDELQRKFYRRLYELAENTCACPSLAYVLFYPLMVRERLPFFLAGNEPAQMLGLYYNGLAPPIAYASDHPLVAGAINLLRLVTLRRPLKRGQFHTLTTMRQLAWGKGRVQKLLGYKNELVDNVVEALQTIPEVLEPLRESLRDKHIPAFIHMDLDHIAGGSYDWRRVRELLVRECGWVPPESLDKALHTSCSIERCKEYSQFIRFYNCRSRMIPFSAIEMSLASRGKNLGRDQAIREIGSSLGFSLEEVPECAVMRSYLEDGR